tara:strand:+ start:8574 stop:8804 length:231 start_codon:yes stop_codon:yes gene_type:complete
MGPEFAEYIPQLAMCESLSLHSLLEPSISKYCEGIHNFILIDVFDSNETQFNKWWDINVVPFVSEFYHLIQNRGNS